jgi:hypothetical protein
MMTDFLLSAQLAMAMVTGTCIFYNFHMAISANAFSLVSTTEMATPQEQETMMVTATRHYQATA